MIPSLTARFSPASNVPTMEKVTETLLRSLSPHTLISSTTSAQATAEQNDFLSFAQLYFKIRKSD